MAETHRLYVGGEWIEGRGGAFDDLNPFTGEVYARAARGTREDAARAVEAARQAAPAWAAAPPSERRRILLKAADVLERRAQDLARVIMEETGGTFGWAMFQL